MTEIELHELKGCLEQMQIAERDRRRFLNAARIGRVLQEPSRFEQFVSAIDKNAGLESVVQWLADGAIDDTLNNIFGG